jgi:hypothetical protein
MSEKVEQFVKIYTKILNDEWYLSLSGIQRSIFLQLIIAIKARTDAGYLCTSSVQHLAVEFGVNRRTLDRFLAKMQLKWPGSVQHLGQGVVKRVVKIPRGSAPGANCVSKSIIRIALPNYLLYQSVTPNQKNIRTYNRDQTRKKDQTSPIYDDVVIELTQLLRNRIVENKEDYKFSDNWDKNSQKAINLMIRKDNRNPDRIRELIEWCQSDNEPCGTGNFCWAPNIRSGAKLREQYDKLDTAMESQPARANW